MPGVTTSPFVSPTLIKPQTLQATSVSTTPTDSLVNSLLGGTSAATMPTLSQGMSAGLTANSQGINMLISSMLNLFRMMFSMFQNNVQQQYPPIYTANSGAADASNVYAPTQPAADTTSVYAPVTYTPPAADNGSVYTPPATDVYSPPVTDPYTPPPANDNVYDPSTYDQGGANYAPAVYTPPVTTPPAADNGSVYTPVVYNPPATDVYSPPADPYNPPPATDVYPPVTDPYTPPSNDTVYDPGTYDQGGSGYGQGDYTGGYDTTPVDYGSGNTGDYWGDPHFNGFDGEKYDVQGQDGKIYNLLSDQNVQFNGRFEAWGDKGATVVGEAGLQVGSNQFHYDKDDAAPTLNGVALEKGKAMTLADGTTAVWDGNDLNVKTAEYSFNIKKTTSNGQLHLDTSVDIIPGANPLADSVAAHGLLGQTANGDGLKKGTGEGDLGAGAQGGGVIDTLDANGNVVVSQKGDKNAVNNYLVSDIFGTTGNAFNRFGVQVDQGRTNGARKDLDGDGKLDLTTVFDTNGNIVMVNPALLKQQNAGAAPATPGVGVTV